MLVILLELLIAAIVLGVVIWLVSQIPGVAPYANIIRVVVFAVFIIYIIWILIGILNGGHAPTLR